MTALLIFFLLLVQQQQVDADPCPALGQSASVVVSNTYLSFARCDSFRLAVTTSPSNGVLENVTVVVLDSSIASSSVLGCLQLSLVS